MNVVVRCVSCQFVSSFWAERGEEVPDLVASVRQRFPLCGCGDFRPVMTVSDQPPTPHGTTAGSGGTSDVIYYNIGGGGGGSAGTSGGTGGSGGGGAGSGSSMSQPRPSRHPRHLRPPLQPLPDQRDGTTLRDPPGVMGVTFNGSGYASVHDADRYRVEQYERRGAYTTSWRSGPYFDAPVPPRRDWLTEPMATTLLMADLLGLSPDEVMTEITADPALHATTLRVCVRRAHYVEATVTRETLAYERDHWEFWRHLVERMAREVRDLVYPEIRVTTGATAALPPKSAPGPRRALDLREDE